MMRTMKRQAALWLSAVPCAVVGFGPQGTGLGRYHGPAAERLWSGFSRRRIQR
jgi:hypothetical protein